MIPEGVASKIRSVTIYYAYEIIGFSFFDKDGLTIFKIGKTDACWSNQKIEITENEVIVGVKTKLWGVSQSIYSDFQFQIAARWD